MALNDAAKQVMMAQANPTNIQRQIIPAFPEELLKQVPPEEASNYSKVKVFPIEILVKADWNYKGDDISMSDRLRSNLKRNGQIENIHVRKLESGFYEVVNGNHRLDEMLALGRRTVLAYDHGECGQAEAIRRCIETNEKYFETIPEKLTEVLSQLAEEFDFEDLSSTLPFTNDKLCSLLDMEVPGPLNDPFDDNGIAYKTQYGVIVICENEQEQEEAFKSLTDSGYKCKVVVT